MVKRAGTNAIDYSDNEQKWWRFWVSTKSLILLEMTLLFIGTVMVRYDNDKRKGRTSDHYWPDLLVWSLRPGLAVIIVASGLIITADVTNQRWPAFLGLMIVSSTLMVEGLQVSEVINSLSRWLRG